LGKRCRGLRRGAYHHDRWVQASATRRSRHSFKEAVRRVAGFGRVDAAPGIAIAHLRPLAWRGVTPAEALAQIGVVGARNPDWQVAIFEYADAWSETVSRQEMTAPPAGVCRRRQGVGDDTR
jgi:hypothetical protein